MRVQKFLANHSSLSRRQVEGLIDAGEITVNGKVIKPGHSVCEGDTIRYQGRSWCVQLDDKPEEAVLLYHKPVGEIVTRSDEKNRPTVFAQLPRAPGGKWIAIGRLDINTQGLIIFVNDGDLAHKLMHPQANLIRRYKVRVFGEVTEEKLEKLKKGVTIEGVVCRFLEIARIVEKEGMNKWFTVSVTSGRYRMVRKMWEAVDAKVSKLVRVQFGPVHLPPDLKQGRFTTLTSEAVTALKKQLDKRCRD